MTGGSGFLTRSDRGIEMTTLRKIISGTVAIVMAIGLAGCSITVNGTTGNHNDAENHTLENDKSTASEQDRNAPKNGDVIILYTSDVHCGIDQGFGYAGLKQVRDAYEAKGYTTLLVDDGDSIQGESIGTITKGEAIIDLMNDLHYDVAIPGDHEFDYGMDAFLDLTKKAEFPYISCNFNREGELIFDPYVIKEAAGIKIAFVGVTTPKTLVCSTPDHFKNEAGDFIYGFLQDDTGEAVYEAVQKAVDGARAEGAEYVYVIGHVGLEADCKPWTYADIIENTNGIDVFLDGHSHDTEQIVMKNKDGEDVVRSAVGTKMNCIGYSHISKDDGIVETDILSWPNKISAPESLDIENDIKDRVDEALDELDDKLSEVVATSDVDLTINDPKEKDASGNPIRMIRRGETNLGDFTTDAFREMLDTDIAVINGGGIRKDLVRGDITYGDIIDVFPFGNMMCVIKATGQQILDALEWGARAVPGEEGGFLQVSGLTYEIDVNIPSGCKSDENGMCTGIEGERRVKNVMVGSEPIDPERYYTVAGIDYNLLKNGDGFTAFEGAEVIADRAMVDNQLLIEYITGRLGGKISDDYSDPYGQGRITITE